MQKSIYIILKLASDQWLDSIQYKRGLVTLEHFYHQVPLQVYYVYYQKYLIVIMAISPHAILKAHYSIRVCDVLLVMVFWTNKIDVVDVLYMYSYLFKEMKCTSRYQCTPLYSLKYTLMQNKIYCGLCGAWCMLDIINH